MTCARPSTPTASALLAIKATTWSMDTAHCLPRLVLKTLAAKGGTGIIKNVFNAQQDGHLLMVYALLKIAIVQLLTIIINALHATKATIFKTESVFYQPKQDQLMLDARNGIGTTKSVLNAQQDGCSVQMEYAH